MRSMLRSMSTSHGPVLGLEGFPELALSLLPPTSSPLPLFSDVPPSAPLLAPATIQVPILVNKQLASHDGVKIVGTSTNHAASVAAALNGGRRQFAYVFSEEDRCGQLRLRARVCKCAC